MQDNPRQSSPVSFFAGRCRGASVALLLLTVLIAGGCATMNGRPEGEDIQKGAPLHVHSERMPFPASPRSAPIEPTVVSYPHYRDPLIWVNRGIFAFNDVTYRYLLIPLGKGYVRVVPDPVQRSVGNFFYNIKTPMYAVNHLLQLKPEAVDETCCASESTRPLACWDFSTRQGLVPDRTGRDPFRRYTGQIRRRLRHLPGPSHLRTFGPAQRRLPRYGPFPESAYLSDAEPGAERDSGVSTFSRHMRRRPSVTKRFGERAKIPTSSSGTSTCRECSGMPIIEELVQRLLEIIIRTPRPYWCVFLLCTAALGWQARQFPDRCFGGHPADARRSGLHPDPDRKPAFFSPGVSAHRLQAPKAGPFFPSRPSGTSGP